MTKRHGIVVFGVALALALCGSGCLRPAPATNVSTSSTRTATTSASGIQPLSLAGLDPHDAARKITFIGGNSLKMHESFTGPGRSLAAGIGLGETVDRSVVIRRFSPSDSAEIEWKTTTVLATKTRKQYVGSVLSGNLRDAHALFPPLYWKEGDGDAFGSGILWLSQDVYQDLAKIHTSTLKFGLEDGQMLEFASSTPELRQKIRDLQAAISKVIDRHDVFATTAVTGTRDLLVNGTSTKVEVLIATNWFGEIQALNNPEDPLVLSVKIDKPGGIDFGGLFDYQITSLSDLQQ